MHPAAHRHSTSGFWTHSLVQNRSHQCVLALKAALKLPSQELPLVKIGSHLCSKILGWELILSSRMSYASALNDSTKSSIYSSLERPCLLHLRQSHLDYNDRAETPSEHSRLASGHLFTASLQMWQPSLRDRSNPENYAVSAAELERLLTTSLNIGIKDDELTPVQIWNLLGSFAIPDDQQREVLEKLTEELSKHVECLQ